MRKDAAFDAEGTTLRGWLYLPDTPEKPSPTIVMAHGFSGVKEQFLDRYAEVFSSAGLAVLVFDNRNFGASDGTPRQEIDPQRQVRDYRDAITYVRTLPEVDRERIGIWGTSYSGGHVLMVAAIDRRVRCVVAQMPSISGPIATSRLVRSDMVAGLRAWFDADREARFSGSPPMMLAVVAEDPATPCALPGKDAWEFFVASRPLIPEPRNEVTVRSIEMAREYEPGAWVERISPTPLLMIVAKNDTLTPTDLALDAYKRALEPKALVLVNGGHFDAYTGEAFKIASEAARDWFVRHL